MLHNTTIYTKAPLYFVRSGDIDIGFGALRASGQYGYAWPAMAAYYTSDITAAAWVLGFDIVGVVPSYGPHARYFGFFLRWLGRCYQNWDGARNRGCEF